MKSERGSVPESQRVAQTSVCDSQSTRLPDTRPRREEVMMPTGQKKRYLDSTLRTAKPPSRLCLILIGDDAIITI